MKLSIIIGRFQPFHLGHLMCLNTAIQSSTYKTIVLIGSANQPRSTKNPFTYSERKEMISKVIEKRLSSSDVSKVIFAPIEDYLYNEERWVAGVQTAVANVCEKYGIKEKVEINLVGHNKDSTSYYLKCFPQWNLLDPGLATMGRLKPKETLSSTNLRNYYFSDLFTEDKVFHTFTSTFTKDLALFCQAIPFELFEELVKFSETPDYAQLLKEKQFIDSYKKQFESCPYPPTFVTTDAVVVQSGHVLMVRRKAEPGKGLLAFPGGFLDASSDRSIDGAMVRELREETRIKVPAPVLLGNVKEVKVFDAIGRSTRGRTITHAYYITLPPGPLPKVKEGSDASKAKWIPISDVKRSECYEDHYEILTYFTGV
jgi:bifunctional NMN adenylyltransferase/nudix hydrolase